MPQQIQLTQAQQTVLEQIKRFITDSNDRVFILKGYAGTGKTTLIKFIAEFLEKKEIMYQLLATTGRAAKVLSNKTQRHATTIHSLIYSFDNLNQDLSDVNEKTQLDDTGQLYLNFEPIVSESENECVYIVDESSMIADEEIREVIQAKFGTGRLLKELLDFDKNPRSKFIFVGDPCQLPPVTSAISPALSKDYIHTTFGFGVQDFELTQIMRQSNDNDIITTAALLRKAYSMVPDAQWQYRNTRVWGRLPFANKKNITLHSTPEELANSYYKKILQSGYDNTIYISRSNRQCQLISTKVRQLLGYQPVVCEGDMLMVIQNQLTTGLMNGDFVKVTYVGSSFTKTFHLKKQQYSTVSVHFVEVRVMECFSQKEYPTLMITDTLVSGNNLNSIQQSGLFLDFAIRMSIRNITQKRDAMLFKDKMYHDPFLNALRCSYGYAVTCHKAQGGEWRDVYVDIPRNFTLNPTKETYQWIYTALTRATENFHCVNDFYIE